MRCTTSRDDIPNLREPQNSYFVSRTPILGLDKKSSERVRGFLAGIDGGFLRCKKSFGEFLTSELVDNSCLACAPYSFSLGENKGCSNPNPSQAKKEKDLIRTVVQIRSFLAGMDGFEPSRCQSQSLVPYRLATSQYLMCVSILSQKLPLVNIFLKIIKKFIKSPKHTPFLTLYH